jgi:NAD(P)-dependent dehydrogenase (short-subunit alcohol dehydrogenase family)
MSRNEMSPHGLFDLTGKVAIVIGGASGIGEAVTLGAAAAGARVICLDIKKEAAEAVAKRATEAGNVPCEAGVLDMRDGAAVTRAFEDVRTRLGSVDIVICTPSINVRKPILQYQPEELDRVLDLNIKGNFNVLQAAGRIITAQKRGSIVLFSSIRSQVVEPGQSAYAATKAGILQLARTAKPTSPGTTRTPPKASSTAGAAQKRWSAPPCSSPPTPPAS